MLLVHPLPLPSLSHHRFLTHPFLLVPLSPVLSSSPPLLLFNQVADVVLCQSMSADGSTKKRLVIMDEVDGMGGSDRGGIPELIKVRVAAGREGGTDGARGEWELCWEMVSLCTTFLTLPFCI
jgi:hypothetical protein